MSKSPDLGVPLLAQSQANPDITHNEALLLFQALSNGVINMTTAAPPGSPTEGDSYVIAAAPTGAWTGFANHIAIFWGGSWRFVPGRNAAGAIITIGARHVGLRVWDRATQLLYIWSGSSPAWRAVSRERVLTVATLPATGLVNGDSAIVTDANAPTLGSIVAGGGAVRVRVNYDGTNWRVG